MKIILELCQEKEFLASQAEGRVLSPSPSLTSPGTDKRHVTVELAESKAKLRRMRQELEEKSEMVLEYKEEVEKYNTTLQKLRQEVQSLPLLTNISPRVDNFQFLKKSLILNVQGKGGM